MIWQKFGLRARRSHNNPWCGRKDRVALAEMFGEAGFKEGVENRSINLIGLWRSLSQFPAGIIIKRSKDAGTCFDLEFFPYDYVSTRIDCVAWVLDQQMDQRFG